MNLDITKLEFHCIFLLDLFSNAVCFQDLLWIYPQPEFPIFAKKSSSYYLKRWMWLFFWKNRAEEVLDPSDKISNAIQLMDEAKGEIDEKQCKKLEFLIEQIKLTLKEPKSRRYFPSLIATAATWKMTSLAFCNHVPYWGKRFRPYIAWKSQ